MAHMAKLHVGLILVICTVELIDASCLSYGHSCWGAHGKRSYPPQIELKPGEPSDRWALFKIIPERNDVIQFKKLLRGPPNSLPLFPENELKSLNFPSIEQQFASSEEASPNEAKDDISRAVVESMTPENEEFLQRHQPGQRVPFMKPFQVVRLDKPNFEQ